jgi:hypothetical protein
VTAEIAFAKRAEDRVGEGMSGNVGIGMTAKSGAMSDLDTA